MAAVTRDPGLETTPAFTDPPGRWISDGLLRPPPNIYAVLDVVGMYVPVHDQAVHQRFGLGRKDDTLPERWFDEPNRVGRFAGEKIERARFEALLDRFYTVSELDREGHPQPAFRARLDQALQ